MALVVPSTTPCVQGGHSVNTVSNWLIDVYWSPGGAPIHIQLAGPNSPTGIKQQKTPEEDKAHSINAATY